jgi:nitroreductase
MDLGQMVIDWMKHAIESKHPLAEKLRLSSVVEGWEKGEDRIFRDAPMVVINHAPEVGALPLENCVIAMTYFELAAVSIGLGACWVGFLMLAANVYLPIKEALGIPKDHKLFGAMIVGYPKYSYQRIPPRNQPDVVWW